MELSRESDADASLTVIGSLRGVTSVKANGACAAMAHTATTEVCLVEAAFGLLTAYASVFLSCHFFLTPFVAPRSTRAAGRLASSLLRAAKLTGAVAGGSMSLFMCAMIAGAFFSPTAAVAEYLSVYRKPGAHRLTCDYVAVSGTPGAYCLT